jgi:hypothetical protein
MLRCSRHFLFTLVLCSALGAAHAAELGEARVSSHIGQPLVADIELAMIDDPAATVSVRIASPEVYNGAGIAMPPVLASLNLSVMRRDGRQFLHVTSLRPVDSEHLHLYLELQEKGQRSVRLATLWLTPDPNPAPLQVPAPAAVAHAEPAPAPVPVRQTVAVPAPRPLAVPKAEAAPGHAGEEGARRPPSAPVAARLHARAPAAAVRAEPKAPPQPLPIHAPQPAPAACAYPAEQAKVCAALDVKNAALKEQLGTLEGKVKSLQATLGAPAVAAPAPATATASAPVPAPAPKAAHEPPRPKPIHAIKPLAPRKPKAPEPEPGLPWGWIGGGVALLLALAGAFLLLRRRRARTVRNVDIPPRAAPDRPAAPILRHGDETGIESGRAKP